MSCVAMQNKTWFTPCKDIFLTATRAPVVSQGTLDVSFQLLDVHGVDINVRATLELLLVRRPILSVNRLVEKKLAVAMGNTLSTDGRVRHLHKSNGCAPRPYDSVVGCHWRIKIQEMMMHHQQKRLVKRTCHGNEDCHASPQRARDWHTRSANCHLELVFTLCERVGP